MSSPKPVAMATIVNQSIFWNIFGLSIGLAISITLDGWKLFVRMRADARGSQSAAAGPTYKML